MKEGEEMTDNTVNVNGAEIYTHRIFEIVDEYIGQELGGDKEKVKESFVDMIFYISDRIPKPSNDDIELLDGIFDIYVRLCARYGVLPTLEIFSFLVGINRSTFTDWSNGEYRSSTAHGNTVKKWFGICKSFVVNRLHNKPGTDANLIFTAKAAYHMRETTPVPVESKPEYRHLASREELGLEAPKERPALPGMGNNS